MPPLYQITRDLTLCHGLRDLTNVINYREMNERRGKMSAMTEDELAKIEARASAATEGPWTCEGGNMGYEIMECPPGIRYSFERAEDGDFVAHARQDVPALVAECRRLREALQAASEHLLASHAGGDAVLGRQAKDRRIEEARRVLNAALEGGAV